MIEVAKGAHVELEGLVVSGGCAARRRDARATCDLKLCLVLGSVLHLRLYLHLCLCLCLYSWRMARDA